MRMLVYDDASLPVVESPRQIGLGLCYGKNVRRSRAHTVQRLDVKSLQQQFSLFGTDSFK